MVIVDKICHSKITVSKSLKYRLHLYPKNCIRFNKILGNQSPYTIIAICICLIISLPYIVYVQTVPPSFVWNENVTKDVSTYIKPDRITTLLEPVEFCSNPLHLLLVVISSPKNFYRRNVIRRTWGLWINSPQTSETVMPNMKLVFILGLDKYWPTDEVGSDILVEQKLFGDIIVEDFLDSYLNLTLKSIFMLKWVNWRCSSAKYIMKVDDDIFVTIPNVLKALQKVNTSQILLMGSLLCNQKPVHDHWSRWYSPQHMFSGVYYPNYLVGAAYIFSGNIVKPLLETAMLIDYFHIEDIFVTGICAQRLGIKPIDNIGFSYERRLMDVCIFNEVIITHNVRGYEMVRMWDAFQDRSQLLRCPTFQNSDLRGYNPVNCSWG